MPYRYPIYQFVPNTNYLFLLLQAQLGNLVQDIERVPPSTDYPDGYVNVIFAGDMENTAAEATALTIAEAAATVVSAADPFYGDGRDGDVVLDGTATNLSRDMYYNNLTLINGATLRPYGRLIYVRGTLRIDAGCTITTEGGGGGAGAIGAGTGDSGGGAAYTASAYSFIGGSWAPGNGGAASSISGSSTSNESALSADIPPLDKTLIPIKFWAGGGGAGGGGHGTSNAARTQGTVSNCGPRGGQGGAATGVGSAALRGGGGGGGGGYMFIAAYVLDNSGTITANGGAGGNGVTSGGNTSGNGGGGGAGCVELIYHTLVNAGTITANGGAAGTGGSGGSAGGNGAVIQAVL